MNGKVLSTAGLLLALFASPESTYTQTHAKRVDPCRDTSGMTQAQMDECASKELARTEAGMDALLRRLGISPSSPEQKAWEAYRDAQMNALYPAEEAASGGSIDPLCIAIARRILIESRIRDLKAFTISREGETCGGYRANAASTTDPRARCATHRSDESSHRSGD